MKQARSRRSSVVVALFGVTLMIAAGLLWWYRASVFDIFLASNYQPSADMRAIVERSGLNSRGERIFYATHPTLSDAQEFNSECHDHEKTSVVLGCFTGLRIYLYDVENAELDGVVDVTAAHEMLHAAYQRLTPLEKPKIEQMVEIEAERLSGDPTFVERMSVYDKLSREDRLNELHAVIGTEVETISPELEAHYARYFTSRQSTVALYHKYSGVFIALQDESEQLRGQLERDADAINKRVADYNTAAKALVNEAEQFRSRVESGGYTSNAELERDRGSLLSRSAALDTEREAIEEASQHHAQEVERYNSISSHINQLNNSLDSTLSPAPDL